MALKLKFRTIFPALVTASSPLTLVKTGLAYVFGLDVNALTALLATNFTPAVFTQNGTGAVPRTVVSKIGEIISASDFVTDTTGTVECAATLQQAIDAVPYGGALYLPYPYLISSSLTRNTPIEIFGHTQTGAGIIMSSSFPTTSDAISITPAGSTTGWRFHDFQISGQGGARGRHGIAINTTTSGATAYDFDISRMLIQATATGNSIRVNNTQSSGGVFTSGFNDNNLESIYLSLIGDTISIRNNSFASQLVSGNASIYVSQITGAGNMQIVGNNGSGLNGILIIDSGVAPIVRDNEFESISGANVYGSMIDIRGSLASVWAPQLMNNQVQILSATAGAALVPVTFGVTTNGSIRGGRLSRPTAGNHIVNGASAVATVIGGDIQSVIGAAAQAIPTVLESGLPFYEQLATSLLGNAGAVPYYNSSGRLVSSAGLSTGQVILATTSGAPIGSNTGTAGQLFLARTGNYPIFATMSQDAAITNAGVVTVTKTNNVSFGALATVTPGTGVATALGVNVGSAGAPILFNGAGGTPSGIVLTFGTGLPTTGLTGTLQATQEPAHTGDVTNTAGSLVLSYTNIVPIAKGGTGASTGAVVSVKKQIFTSSGTYTPSTGMIYAVIECVGSGGGGGSAAGTVGNIFSGGGGGSGSYSRLVVPASSIGASQIVTIGAAGGGGATGSNNGGNGADVSVGSLCIGKGGSGGKFGSIAQGPTAGAGGVAGTGDLTAAGSPGASGFYNAANTTIAFPSGNGGSSIFGGGAQGVTASAAVAAGNNATNYGGGGSGAVASSIAANAAGGNGSTGVVFITDFNSQ